MRNCAILCLVGCLWSGGVAEAATYYVSKQGSDSNGGTEAAPFLTINKGVSKLTAGDTLLVRAGVYDEAVMDAPSGTSWSSIVRIAAYPNETVWMRPTSGTPTFVVYLANNQKYIEFDGINMDGAKVKHAVVKIEGWSGGNAHHIRVKNAELIGNPTDYTQTVIATKAALSNVGGNEFINLRINAGGLTDLDHAFYIQSSDNVIQGCEIWNFTGGAVHLYNGYGFETSNNTVRNNIIRDGRNAGANSRHWGIIVANGATNTKVYNNLVYSIPYEGGSSAGIYLFTGLGTLVYNNTVYGNAGEGIAVDAAVDTTTVTNNIVYSNQRGNYRNNGVRTTGSNNLIGTDPRFSSVSGRDFTLKTGSPAIDAAMTLQMVGNDLRGTPRPQGGAYDIGAYESGALKAPASVKVGR